MENYDVALLATNEYGESLFSKEHYIHVGDVGLDEYEQKLFSVYPNPCNGKLFIEARKETDIDQVLIRSVNGQVVLTHHPSKSVHQTLDLSGLEAGLYFIEMRTTDKVYLEKVVVK